MCSVPHDQGRWLNWYKLLRLVLVVKKAEGFKYVPYVNNRLFFSISHYFQFKHLKKISS
jgi:hypothetical protein